MANTIDQSLKPRAIIIAAVVANHRKNWEWWGGYTAKEGLAVAEWDDTMIDYRRRDGVSPTLILDNLQVKTIVNPKESTPVLLNSKVIDAASIEVDNLGSDTPQDWEYSGEFEKTTSKEEAFTLGFEQSISSATTIGNDASPAKEEITVSLGFNQSTTDTTSESERESRVFSFKGDGDTATPGRIRQRITAWRKVSRMKSVITGTVDPEHSITIGKHWHGKWQGGKAHWDSFADFMRCVKGEAPSGYSLADAFRENPVQRSIIRQLEKPLDIPYTQTLDFDQATSAQIKKVDL